MTTKTMMMGITSQRALQLLAQSEAILNGHFVGTSGKHLSVYVAKDKITRFTSLVSELCASIAEQFADAKIEAVVAPAVGAIALSQWTAYHLSRLRPDLPEVLAVYAEREEKVVRERKKGDEIFSIELDEHGVFGIDEGDSVIVRKPDFVLKRGFGEDVKGKRVLGVEDILTTGSSAAMTAKCIAASGGILVGFGAIANGGKITASDIGVDVLKTVVQINREIFTEEECARSGLCARNIPINTDFGHGAAFLAKQKNAAA